MKNLLRAGAVALVMLACESASAQTAGCASYDAAGTCIPGVALFDPRTHVAYKAGDLPVASTANRVVTKTSVAANTSTPVCPAATAPASTEIEVQTGAIGLGLNGQTLTSATYGTTTASPDIVFATAGTIYTMPVAATNAITAYTATAQIVICIQTLRQ